MTIHGTIRTKIVLKYMYNDVFNCFSVTLLRRLKEHMQTENFAGNQMNGVFKGNKQKWLKQIAKIKAQISECPFIIFSNIKTLDMFYSFQVQNQTNLIKVPLIIDLRTIFWAVSECKKVN